MFQMNSMMYLIIRGKQIINWEVSLSFFIYYSSILEHALYSWKIIGSHCQILADYMLCYISTQMWKNWERTMEEHLLKVR